MTSSARSAARRCGSLGLTEKPRDPPLGSMPTPFRPLLGAMAAWRNDRLGRRSFSDHGRWHRVLGHWPGRTARRRPSTRRRGQRRASRRARISRSESLHGARPRCATHETRLSSRSDRRFSAGLAPTMCRTWRAWDRASEAYLPLALPSWYNDAIEPPLEAMERIDDGA